MPRLELEGRIVRLLPVQSGRSARGEWSKQEFVLEFQEGNFPSNACMSVWGQDKVADLARFKEGDIVRVSFNISSREFNGRWYTDLRAWQIQQTGGAAAPAAADGGDIPAGFAPAGAYPAPPAPTAADEPAFSSDDDLPF